MKKFYKLKFVLLAFLVISTGFLSSCDDDDESSMNNGQVQLLSFGPTGVKHGETIKFIGYNLDKVESIQLAGALVPKTEFTSHTADLIELTVPVTASQGQVVLRTTDGEEITSKSVLSFEVPVVIESLTAEAKPGTTITITGNFLNWVDSVKFGSMTTNVTSFVSQSMTELVLTVPMTARTGRLTLYTGGTEPMALETEESLVVTLPVVSSLSPASLKHGANLTITGTDLDLVKEVRFTGVGTASVNSFVSQSETEIVVTVPDNTSTGTLTLVALSDVEVPTTQSLSIILPAITDLAPSPIEHGTNLTITGTDLDLVKTIVFTGGTEVSSFVSQSPTRIVVKVPATALKGTLTLITHRNYTVQTLKVLEFIGDLPPLEPLPYALFDDARRAGWDDYGWGGATVWNSREMVRQGDLAVKKTYDGSYDAVRFHAGTPLSMSGYTEITFSVFGAPGTGGKDMNLVINEAWGSPYTFKIVEGEWTTYNIKLSSLGNPATIGDLLFQSAGWAGVVHYDHIGFK